MLYNTSYHEPENVRQQQSYEGQQNFQVPTNYQREPSPTDAAKYLSRGGSDAQNVNFRDNKFSSNQDVNQTPSNNNQSHATQNTYGYSAPIYTYAPYIPNQYNSYQNPQHSQYPYPRYYRAYPNYSGTTPAYPTPTPSSTVYTDDMVQAV